MGEYGHQQVLDATGLRFAVVVGRYNDDITNALLEGADRVFDEANVERIVRVSVPGAFELPVTALHLARSGEFHAVVCLGAVVRGDTPHFDYVAGECARGLQQVALETGVPVVFGVLTTDDREQALARVGGSEGHKGEEAAATAIEMARLIMDLRDRGRTRPA